MKKILLPALLAAACCCKLLHSQETDLPQPLDETVVKAQVALDSDGDLVPDELDQNPLLPDIPAFSWWVSEVTVGWDLDQSQIDKIDATNGNETVTQRKTSFTVGGGIGGGGGFSQGINSDPSAIFLSLLPGGGLLKKAGDDFSAQSSLAVSFELKKSLNRIETVKEIRSEFQKLEKQRAIKNRHIEFTVEFFNDTNDPYRFSNYSIPVQTAARQTRAEALCYVAGEMKQEFEVPANRPSGYPVRFRAMLSTTQSEQILNALETGELRLAIERASGKAINLNTDIDEIALRQKIANQIAENTSILEFRTGENATKWRVARKNPVTGRPTTIAEAIAAVNQMAASVEDTDYIETCGGMVYSVGSFRNTPQNAFEVTNTETAPLQALGWVRMDRYGMVRDGEWAHALDDPIGQGVAFSWLPFEVTKEKLALQIHTCDPQVSSEWLALCHYWLHYDEQRPFAEYPLSITEYPLVPLFQSLQPDYAKADFEKTVSKWIAGNAGVRFNDEESAIENRDFQSKVKLHRKAILDAAFDGYSEAGALFARLPDSDRDEIERKAIYAALQIGNTDAAAVESCNRLSFDLQHGRQVNLDEVKIPNHVFARNFYGFLRFEQCERGHVPGRARDSALESFAYSANLGNSFATAMKGWMLVNTATQKRRKLFDGAQWDRDRDAGIKLLREAAEDSVLAKYVLADLYYNNRIGIAKNMDLAKQYLLFAADRNFGNASKMYVERF